MLGDVRRRRRLDGRLHVDARWTDVVDDGHGPLRSRRQRRAWPRRPSARTPTVAESAPRVLDTRCRHAASRAGHRRLTFRRALRCRRVGIERPGDEVVVHVPNRGRPPVLPILASDDRSTSGPGGTGGDRPAVVGDGPEELLGVVVRGPAAEWSWEVTSPASSWWQLDDAIGSVDAEHVLAATDVVRAVPVPALRADRRSASPVLPVRFDEALDAWVADLRLRRPGASRAAPRAGPLSAASRYRGCHISAITELGHRSSVGVPAETSADRRVRLRARREGRPLVPRR